MHLPRSLPLLAFGVAMHAFADPVTQPARAVSYRTETHAWARVESVAPLELRTPVAGRVERMNAVPGQAVAAGTPLVWLAGPRLGGELAAASARANAARGELSAAEQSAASVARNYPALVDRRTLEAAHAAVAAAKGRLAEADAARLALVTQTRLTSPLAAVVSAVSAVPGTDLPAGAPLVTLLPRGRLWLRAEVFGPRPQPGGEARFVPVGGAPIPVRLANELPARAADGAREMNFAPVAADPDWQAGEVGEVVVSGPAQSAVAVPAAALILDAGRWYVLTDARGKLAAQAVKPGPTRGDDVLVLAGLDAGTRVVVRQAYLLYHRGFAARYTPPD